MASLPPSMKTGVKDEDRCKDKHEDGKGKEGTGLVLSTITRNQKG